MVQKTNPVSSVPKIKKEVFLNEERKDSVMGKLVETMKNPPIVGDLIEGYTTDKIVEKLIEVIPAADSEIATNPSTAGAVNA